MKLGFLGYGNLARALCRGFVSQGALSPADIAVCAKSEATLSLARGEGFSTASTAAHLFSVCDIVFIAVKPRVFREMASELSAIDTRSKRAVSVMAAVHLDEILSVLRCPILRLMPTLAAADGCDIMGYTASEDAFADLLPLLSHLGEALSLDEDMLDRLTVAASCGLGFAANILDAYSRECEKYGFSSEQSRAITGRMFGYAASSGDFAALRTRVATRGGVTEAGNNAMNAPLSEALSAAFCVAGELAAPPKK